MKSIKLSDLVREYAPVRARKHPAWTWEDEAQNVDTRMCLCCGRPGHYQKMLESHIKTHGIGTLAIYLDSGYIGDGHHRVVAAIRLNLNRIPIESKSDAGDRWVKNHGMISWEERKVGDV